MTVAIGKINLSPFLCTGFGLLLMMGMYVSAEASLLGLVGDHWKEEVLQHDGSKIIVERSQNYFFQALERWPRVKEHSIAFTTPGSDKSITWTSEYSEEIGTTNFKLLALHIYQETPYIVATPNLCLSYNKWGRPNPPYVIFRYEGNTWKRIFLSEFPADLNEINLLIEPVGSQEAEDAIKAGYVSAVDVKKLNNELKQPEYKTILREAQKIGAPGVGGLVTCEEMIHYKCGWISPHGSFGRDLMDKTCK